MKKIFEVKNVKCSGCANTLIKSLKNEFGDVEVDLSVNPRKISLYVKYEKEEKLKIKLRSLGYPLATDELSGLEKITVNAKSFASCAIGKFNESTKK